jgi:hypothetical protein
MVPFVRNLLLGGFLPKRLTGFSIQTKDDELMHFRRFLAAPKTATAAPPVVLAQATRKGIGCRSG